MKAVGQVSEQGLGPTIKKVIKTIIQQCTQFRSIIKKKTKKVFKLQMSQKCIIKDLIQQKV